MKEKRKKKQKTKTKTEKNKWGQMLEWCYKWFCCAFKLGSLQLICKASLIFKSNLDLSLSIVLKQRELSESKHVAVEYRCLKIWDHNILWLIQFSLFYNNWYS